MGEAKWGPDLHLGEGGRERHRNNLPPITFIVHNQKSNGVNGGGGGHTPLGSPVTSLLTTRRAQRKFQLAIKKNSAITNSLGFIPFSYGKKTPHSYLKQQSNITKTNTTTILIMNE